MRPSFIPTSPIWSRSTKRLVSAVLLGLALLLLYWTRGLLIYVLLSTLIAYLLHPLVSLLHRRVRLPWLAAVAIIYLFIVAALVAIPLTTIPQVLVQLTTLTSNAPRYLEELQTLLQEPIVIRGYELPLNDLPLLNEAIVAVQDDLVGIAQIVGEQSLTIFGSLATATLSTVAWLLVVLFLSFYLLKDHHLFFDWVVATMPPAYQDDIYRLGGEIGAAWNAFLRGQLILFTIMSITVFSLATIIGLPNALLLGLVSGLAEFLPQIGATLAMIPAVLVAFFQSDASWLGRQLGPFWFTLLIMGVYILLQQIENYFVVPRVIGRQLNLHPLVVFIAALIGASAAGVLGIIVAAPLLASGRVILRYIYNKLLDRPPFPDEVVARKPVEIEELTFRPARPDDEPAVAAIAAQTWDGEDYVAGAFDDWVADESGQFTVVYEGDELVAFSKLTRLAPAEWWLEGLRVAPQHRQRGLGRLMHRYNVELAEQSGAGILRLATATDNVAVEKLAFESGFHLVSRHLLAETSARPGGVALPFTLISAAELDEARYWLEGSPIFTACGGLAEDEWVWYDICARLPIWQAEGLLYWWAGGTSRQGIVIVHRVDEETCWLNYLDVPDGELAAVAETLPALAHQQGARRLKGKPLDTPVICEALKEAGWEVEETGLSVFERPLGNGTRMLAD